MGDHIVSAFEKELGRLSKNTMEMGSIAKLQLKMAIKSIQKDKDSNSTIIDDILLQDKILDKMEHELEEDATSMIARRQPMAMDLRQIITSIKIASDLERIGDLSVNIVKRLDAISYKTPSKRAARGFVQMGSLVKLQLKTVLTAYKNRDTELATQVWLKDEEVDLTYSSLFRELLTDMMENHQNISLCTHLLFGARNLERIGDHATNIAENVYYLVKGQLMPDNRPKQDEMTLGLNYTYDDFDDDNDNKSGDIAKDKPKKEPSDLDEE